jgi:CBS domain-containing protein
VVDDAGHLLAIVADGDLREHVGYLPTTRVSAAMVEKPTTISADASIATAAELMVSHKVGGLPVLDGAGQLIGIVTESDLLRAPAENLPKQPGDATDPAYKHLPNTAICFRGSSCAKKFAIAAG